jgi:hypothetical protein
VRTYHAFAMYQMGKSTAAMRVVMEEAKMWKSHVNATTWRVHSRFGSLCLAPVLTWPVDNDRYGSAASVNHCLWR